MKRRRHATRKTAELLRQCEKYYGIYLRRTVRPGSYSVPGYTSYTTTMRPEWNRT
jgi:hypothetical protein